MELGGVRHASFQEVKIRMKSVKNIQKITKAMKMVAASKLRKAQRVALASRGIQEPFTRFFGEQCAESAAKTVLVPVTSDRGLCGGINSNIVKYGGPALLRVWSATELLRLLSGWAGAA